MLNENDAPRVLRTFPYAPQASQPGYGPRSVEQALKWLRASANPRAREAINSSRRIVITPDGRPIRSAITGRRVIVTGSYASRKTRCTHPHESMNERAFLQESEVDVDVVDYRAQPFRFEFSLGGERRIYIADICRVLASGDVEVVEVKSDHRHLRDLDYAAKLDAVAEMCRAVGWSFRTVTKSRLFNPPARRANIELIQSNKYVPFNSRDVYAAIEVITEGGGEAAFGRICDAIGGPQIGAARAMAMMVGRVLRIDLRSPIAGPSRVTLVSDERCLVEGAR